MRGTRFIALLSWVTVFSVLAHVAPTLAGSGVFACTVTQVQSLLEDGLGPSPDQYFVEHHDVWKFDEASGLLRLYHNFPTGLHQLWWDPLALKVIVKGSDNTDLLAVRDAYAVDKSTGMIILDKSRLAAVANMILRIRVWEPSMPFMLIDGFVIYSGTCRVE